MGTEGLLILLYDDWIDGTARRRILYPIDGIGVIDKLEHEFA